jgi:hypothetical protein
LNNILQYATTVALWNAAIYTNPVDRGFNIFWRNEQNYDGFEHSQGDLIIDPRIDLVNGTLLESSPAIDAGAPDILDRDGSRSDIGPFGGPWAYTNN